METPNTTKKENILEYFKLHSKHLDGDITEEDANKMNLIKESLHLTHNEIMEEAEDFINSKI